MPTIFRRALFLLIVVTLFSQGSYAQVDPIKLVPNESGFRPVPGFPSVPTTAKIGVNNQLYVEAYYHNFSDTKPVAVIATFTDKPRNTINQTYLVAIIDEKDKNKLKAGVPVLLYGPQFYEGHPDIQMQIDLVVLKQEHVERLRSKADSIFNTAFTLLPVIGQFSSWYKTAWDVFQEFGGKNSEESMGEIHIPRLNDSAETFEAWHIMGTPESLTPWRGVQSFGAKDSDGELEKRKRPVLTNSGSGKGRVMVISVFKDNAMTAYDNVANRICETFNSSADRLKKNQIELESPCDVKTLKEKIMLRQYFNAFLSTLEAQKSGTTAEQALADLVNKLNNSKDAGCAECVILDLKGEAEQRVTANLNRFLSYGVGGKEGQGFSSITTWSVWLEKRRNANAIEWIANAIQPTYGKAKTTYVEAKVKEVLPDTPPESEKLLSGGAIRSKFRPLLKIFASSADDPYMLFEQREAATLIKSRLQLKSQLHDINANSTAADIRTFAGNLQQALVDAVLMERRGNTWVAVAPKQYALSKFRNALRSLAEKDEVTVNKHQELLAAYIAHIEPYKPLMTEAEVVELDAELDGVFSIAREKLSKVGVHKLFADDVFSISKSGQIIRPPASEDFLETTRFLAAAYGDPFLMQRLPAQLTNKVYDSALLRELATDYVAREGLDLSIRQRAVMFLIDHIISFSEIPGLTTVPKSPEEMKSWYAAAKDNLDSIVWNVKLRKFVASSEASEMAIIKSIVKVFETGTPSSKPKDGEQKLKDLIDIRLDETKSAAVRELALTELRAWVELPPDLKAMDDATSTPWLAFKDRTPTWSSCKRYVAAGFPCTPLPPTE